ncbi:unnamed protein product, partial [Didymodactylos carnosus]
MDEILAKIMPLKRKVRNLPQDECDNDQMSFFDPVYEISLLNNDMNDSDKDSGEGEDDESIHSLPRQRVTESDDILSAADLVTSNGSDQIDQISTTKIANRIKQIQNSLKQAKTMLEPMEKMKDLITSTPYHPTSEQVNNEDFYDDLNQQEKSLQNSKHTIVRNPN